MSTHTIERVAPPLAARFPGKYVSLVSFKRDGTPVATPLWFVVDGDRLLAITDAHSAKVKRIRRNPDVTLAPCKASGHHTGELVAARAEVLPPDELEPAQSADGAQVPARSRPDPARLQPRPATPRQAAVEARPSYWRSRRVWGRRMAAVLSAVELTKRFGDVTAVTTCRSRSRRAASPASSARTAPGRRRRCACCSASPSRPMAARSSSAAASPSSSGRRPASAPCSRPPTCTRAAPGAITSGFCARAARVPPGRVEEVLALVELGARPIAAWRATRSGCVSGSALRPRCSAIPSC